MSDELELDENGDSSLDSMLNEFDDDGFGDDPFSEKKKGVVDSVLTGAKDTTVNTIKNPGTLASMAVDKALPKEVKNIVNPALEIKDSFKDALVEKSKGLRNELKPILSKIDSVVPEQGMVRKGFDVVKSVLAADDEYGSSGPSIEEEARQQADSVWRDGEVDRIQNIIQQSLEHNRGMTEIELQRSTLKEVSQFNQYTLQITSNYQRKSLELRYRMAAMFKNYMEIFKQYATDSRKQLEAIVSNTSLPDFAKLKTSKALVQQVRADINKRIIDRLYGNTNYVDNIINNLTDRVGSTLSNIGDALGMVSGVGGDDLGIDKKEMAGSLAAEGLMGLAMGAGRKKLEAKGRKSGILSKLDYFSRSMPDALEDFSRKSEDKGFIQRKLGGVAGWLADLARPPSKDVRMDRVNELSPEQIRNYDVRSKISLIEVIPGYLSRILREVIYLARGEDTELLKYSYTSRAFVGESKITDFIKKELESVSEEGGLERELDRITSVLEEKGGVLDNDLREKLRTAIVKNAIEGDAVGLNRLNSRGFFDNFTDEETDKVKSVLSNYIRNSEDKHIALGDFKEMMERVRQSVPDTTTIIKDAIDRGGSDSLMQLGVLEPTMDGKVTLNNAMIQKILAGAGKDARVSDYEEYLQRKAEEEEEQQQGANVVLEKGRMLRDKVMGKVTPEKAAGAAKATSKVIKKYTPKPVKTVFNKLYGKDSLLQKGTKAAISKTAGLIDTTIKKEGAIKNAVRGVFGKPKVKVKGPRLKARLRKLRGSTKGILKKIASGIDTNLAVVSNLENEYGVFMEDVIKDTDAGPSEPFTVETSKNTAISNIYLDNIVNILKDFSSKTDKKKPKRFEDELNKLRSSAEKRKKRIKERLEARKAKRAAEGKDTGKGILSGIPLIASLISKTKDAVVGKLGFIGSIIESIAEVMGASYVGKKAMDLTGFGGEGKERKKINLKKGKGVKRVSRFSKLKGIAKGGLKKFGKLGPIGLLAGLTLGAGDKLLDGASSVKDKLFGMFGESAAKKEGTKIAEKATGKIAGKAAAKGAGKLLAKSALKKIPLVGALAGLGFGISRMMDGDWAGAGLEIASGLAGGSGLGFLASVGIDGYLAKRDMDKEESATIKALQPEVAKAIDRVYEARDTLESTKAIDRIVIPVKALVKSGITDKDDLNKIVSDLLSKRFKADKDLIEPVTEYIVRKAILEVGSSNVTSFVTPDIVEAMDMLLRGNKVKDPKDLTDPRKVIGDIGRKRRNNIPQRTPSGLINGRRVGSSFKNMAVPTATAPGAIDLEKYTDATKYVKTSGADLNGLNPAVYKQFTSMAAEYFELTGKKLQVNSANRTKQDQATLRGRMGNNAAPPGRSLHEFGLALDINTVDADELDRLGLMRKYGFTRPLRGETWHIEPAFVQFALDEVRKDPKLAAKIAMESMGYGGGGLGAITKKGDKPVGRDLQLAKNFAFGNGTDANETGLVPVANKTVRKLTKLPPLQGDYIPAKEVTIPKRKEKPVVVSKTEPQVPPVNGAVLNKEIPGVNTNLNTINNTLLSSLDVQREILVVLKEFKEMKEKAAKESGNNPPAPPTNTTIPQPAINMGRMTRV